MYLVVIFKRACIDSHVGAIRQATREIQFGSIIVLVRMAGDHDWMVLNTAEILN